MKTDQAEQAALVPGSERIGPREVRFSHNDYREVYRAWRALQKLGA
ncbi:MAG: M55 family metallopeptidase [Oscillochloris sp.]|nr:M55 family metallopeptidase [Oscillochloris sp.]